MLTFDSQFSTPSSLTAAPHFVIIRWARASCGLVRWGVFVCALPYCLQAAPETARCSKRSGRVCWWTRASARKKRCWRLAAVERLVGRLDGIVISHEHTDHIGGLAQVLGQWRTTVYLTEATHSEVKRILPESSQKRLDHVEHIRAGHRFI